MNNEYTIRFLHILASVVIAGLIIFLFPQAEIPSYITIFISLFLAFLFITVQVSNPELNKQLTFFQQIKKYLSQSSSIFFVLLIVSFLIAIFVGFYKKIYELQPPQEFTTLKWVSFIVLTFQLGLLFMYLINEVKDTISMKEGNSLRDKIYSVLMKNGKLYVNLLTLVNSFITLALYVIIAKFTTDG